MLGILKKQQTESADGFVACVRALPKVDSELVACVVVLSRCGAANSADQVVVIIRRASLSTAQPALMRVACVRWIDEALCLVFMCLGCAYVLYTCLWGGGGCDDFQLGV